MNTTNDNRAVACIRFVRRLLRAWHIYRMKINDVALRCVGDEHWIEVFIDGEWVKAQTGVNGRNATVFICRETLFERRYPPNVSDQATLTRPAANTENSELK